jgi:hypothetical protein
MPQSNTIEVKYINALSEKSGKPKRWQATINKQLVNSKVLHIDILGNIKKITKF